jgi:hypothetical protein
MKLSLSRLCEDEILPIYFIGVQYANLKAVLNYLELNDSAVFM